MLPSSITVTAGGAPLDYTIPGDTFWSNIYGFNLTYQVNDPLPAWMLFDASTRTLSGIPTNTDAGAVLFKVSAADVTGLQSPEVPFSVVANLDPQTVFLFTAAMTVGVPAQVRRRTTLQDLVEAAEDCNSPKPRVRRAPPTVASCKAGSTLTAAERMAFQSALGTTLALPLARISILSIQVVSTSPCHVEVEWAASAVSSCQQSEALDTDLQNAVADGSLAAALLPSLVFVEVQVNATVCSTIVVPPAGATGSTQSDFSASIVPVAVIAGVILLVGLVALLVLRHRNRKSAKGIDSTFEPRAPTVLGGERALDFSEYNVAHDLSALGLGKPDYSARDEPPPPSFAAAAAEHQPSRKPLPKYKPPPPYARSKRKSRSSRVVPSSSSDIEEVEAVVTLAAESAPWENNVVVTMEPGTSSRSRNAPPYMPPPSYVASRNRNRDKAFKAAPAYHPHVAATGPDDEPPSRPIKRDATYAFASDISVREAPAARVAESAYDVAAAGSIRMPARASEGPYSFASAESVRAPPTSRAPPENPYAFAAAESIRYAPPPRQPTDVHALYDTAQRNESLYALATRTDDDDDA